MKTDRQYRPVQAADFFGTLTERFGHACVDFAERTAVVGRERLTYAELDRITNCLAHALVKHRVDLNHPVAILAPPGIEFVSAVLGTLRAGGSYLSLDVRDSTMRLAETIDDIGCRTVIVHPDFMDRSGDLRKQCPQLTAVYDIEMLGSKKVLPAIEPPTKVTPTTRACVFHTSGSTGKSVGVSMSHGFVLSDILRQTNDLAISCEDRFDLLFSPVFSASLAPMFGALLNGAGLWIFETAEQGVHRIASWLQSSRISLSTMSVSTMRTLLDSLTEGENLAALRLVSVGGEPLWASDVHDFQRKVHRKCLLQNAMATTETRTYAQLFLSHDDDVSDPVPVGFGVNDRTIRLRDDRGQDVLPGETGEIVVDGRLLSDGYVNEPSLTHARFEQLPNGLTRYRTGDYGRFDDRGRLICIGRKDSIVKIRGHRIETNIVQRAFEALDSVERAAVLADEANSQELRLAAFLQLKCSLSTEEIRKQVGEHLPQYAIPQQIVPLESLPQTATGKVDRQELHRILSKEFPRQHSPSQNIRQPVDGGQGILGKFQNMTEQQLGEIWRTLLCKPVSRSDDFFDLGGDSLAAVPLLTAVEKQLGCRLSFQQLSEHSKLGELAQLIEQSEPKKSPMVKLESGRSESNCPPMFFVSGIMGYATDFQSWVDNTDGLFGDLYAFETAYLSSDTESELHLDAVARQYVACVEEVADGAPVIVGGYSWGGLVAHEMACQLRDRDIPVELLVIFDTPVPGAVLKDHPSCLSRLLTILGNLPAWIRYDLCRMPWSVTWNRFRGTVEQAFGQLFGSQDRDDATNVRRFFGRDVSSNAGMDDFKKHCRAATNLTPEVFCGKTLVVRARAQSLTDPRCGALGWEQFVVPNPLVRVVGGNHKSMMEEPYVREIVSSLRLVVDKAVNDV